MFVTWGQRFSCLFLFPVDYEASQGNWDSSKSFPVCQMLKNMYKFVFNTFHTSIRVSYWPCPVVLRGMQHRAWWTSSLPTRILLLLIMLPLKLICIDKHFFFNPVATFQECKQEVLGSAGFTYLLFMQPDIPTVSEAHDGYLSSKTLNILSHWTRKCTHGIITVVSNHLAFFPGLYVHIPFVHMETSVDCCSVPECRHAYNQQSAAVYKLSDFIVHSTHSSGSGWGSFPLKETCLVLLVTRSYPSSGIPIWCFSFSKGSLTRLWTGQLYSGMLICLHFHHRSLQKRLVLWFRQKLLSLSQCDKMQTF